MKRPEPLSRPLIGAISRAQSEGARVARIRLSEQFLQGLILEEEPLLTRKDGVGPDCSGYFFDRHPIVISRISGWVLETWAKTSSAKPTHADQT